MKLAFCLFNFFHFGGLQRDFLRIAEICKKRGHDIHVYTQAWEGKDMPEFKVHLIEVKGWQNHTQCRNFAAQLSRTLSKASYDLVIGFNKLPSLDVYYAADSCLKERLCERNKVIQHLPRYRQLLSLENAVFAQGNPTKIFLISPLQQKVFTHHYQTEDDRFYLLPPGISKDRLAPAHAHAIRHRVRYTNLLTQKHILLLFIASSFKTKGLDRVIKGLAALPYSLRARCKLYVLGEDHPQPFLKLGQKMGVIENIYFLGGRHDVPEFLFAADLLVHPALYDNTGTVLLEAVCAGLPVLTVDACGYADHIRQAQAGMILKTPFDQNEFNTTLQLMITTSEQKKWRKNALRYANTADIYSLAEKAADKIEDLLGKKNG